MFFPEATQSDELGKDLNLGDRWPFLQVHDILVERGIAVPEILACDRHHGLLVVEDLGDDTLATYVERNPQARVSSIKLRFATWHVPKLRLSTSRTTASSSFARLTTICSLGS